MAQAAFGQLASWDDAVPSGGGDFLNMKDDGDYVLRFLTEIPYEYPVHWVELGPNKRVKIKCAGPGCLLCEKDNKSKNTFLANVLNRTDGQCYVYEFGRQIFDQLKSYAKNPKWGDIRRYDVRINKKKGRKPNVYIVQAEPPIEELSAAEKEAANEHCSRMDLNKLAAPYTNDDIRRKLAEHSGEELPEDNFSQKSQTQTPPTTGFDPMENQTDFEFPEFK